MLAGRQEVDKFTSVGVRVASHRSTDLVLLVYIVASERGRPELDSACSCGLISRHFVFPVGHCRAMRKGPASTTAVSRCSRSPEQHQSYNMVMMLRTASGAHRAHNRIMCSAEYMHLQSMLPRSHVIDLRAATARICRDMVVPLLLALLHGKWNPSV